MRDPRSEMQHLIKCFVEDKYMCRYRLIVDFEIVIDIFWTFSDDLVWMSYILFDVILLIIIQQKKVNL